jgi:hypothetical protein
LPAPPNGHPIRVDKAVRVAEVKAFRTKSGNTRFVLVDDDGDEYTTFRESIARSALEAEGKRARITYHEQQRNGFTNVYLDKVEPLPDEERSAGDDAGDPIDEAAWRTAVEAAPYLLGSERKVEAEELFEDLKPFKELVAEDIRDGET